MPQIVEIVKALPDVESILDPFSGTARVGHALKREGYTVIAGDHNRYAYTLARCYVEADHHDWHAHAVNEVRRLNALPGSPGYFTETFCEQSRFFHPKNGARVDAIREDIAAQGYTEDLEAILLVSLMEAADRVDSTTGVQMAYLKQWAPRALKDMELRVPELLPGAGLAYYSDANYMIRQYSPDLVYLDPPYNQHSYRGNYHIWESLVRGDKPEVYGIACKRIDCKEYHSPFNSKREAKDALADLIRSATCPYLLVSFNDEGHISRAEVEEMLGQDRAVETFEIDYKRYVGAQIGIHNPKGEKVGHVSHTRNTEYLYLAAPEPSVLRDVRRTLSRTAAAA